MERRSRLVIVTIAVVVLALAGTITLAVTGNGPSAAGPAQQDPSARQPPAAGQSSGGASSAPLSARSATMRTTTIGSQEIEHCSNGPVDQPDPGITTVVIVIHGLGGKPCPLTRAVMESAGSDTLVIAPEFGSTRAPDHHTWPGDGWAVGHRSQASTRAQPGPREEAEPPARGTSSFAIVDELIRRADGEDPSRRVLVAGFSAGGQFVNRYAASSSITADEYLVMSPSSYLWFNQDRPNGTARSLASRCPMYNDYRYGLARRNGYTGAVSAAEMKRRYAQRTITYLVGGEDDRRRSVGLDRSCPAMAQGDNREDRARNYHRALDDFFGDEVLQRHHFAVVPNVAHNGPQMLRSEAARKVFS